MKITKLRLLIIVLAVILSKCAFAQDKKISQLTALPSISGNEYIPCEISGNNYYLTPSQFVSWMALSHSYIPLNGTVTGYPMTGIFQINSNSIIGDKTGHTVIFGAGNLLSRSATRYGAYISHKDSIKVEHRDTLGNFQKFWQYGNTTLLQNQNATYTNTIVQTPSVTTVNKPVVYSGNLHSLLSSYMMLDKSAADSLYAPISYTATPSTTLTGDITGTGTGTVNTTNTNSITINGTTQALHGNPSFTVSTGSTSVTATSPLSVTSGSAIAISQANTSTNGYLSSTDWTTFNNKLSANQTITYTAIGDVSGTASGATSISPTMSLSASQPNITSAANQTTIGTVTVGTWNSIIKPVTTSTTSASTFTIAATTQQMEFTALAANLTLYTSGSPNDGQKLIIRIIDNGSPQTLTFNSVFNFGNLVIAPTTTVAGRSLYIGFIYNGTTSKWDCVASNQF